MRERAKLGVFALQASIAASFLVPTAGAAHDSSDPDSFALLERGRYLALLGDCAACHDDPAQDRPFGGGRLIGTPFGNVAAPNITPDRDTGIGAWSDDQFDAALRQGKRPDDKRLYPAMPYPYYTKMSRSDVKAIRAYLNTVQPVHNVVVADQLPFPFNIRLSMLVWNALYFDPGEFIPNPERSSEWNRGAYIVEGPGHCGACHTPKGRLGGDSPGEKYAGYSIQGWFAPDITDDTARGLGGWSPTDIVQYLKTGHNRIAGAAGPMAEEVRDSSSQMKRSDLEAIAVYLKDRKGQAAAARALPGDDSVMSAGAAIYDDLCAACHKADGTGVPYLIPDLASSASVASRDPTTLFQVIFHGAQTVATREEPTAPAMPAFGWQLSDAQVAAVVTFVRNSWGHAAPGVTVADAHSARATLHGTD